MKTAMNKIRGWVPTLFAGVALTVTSCVMYWILIAMPHSSYHYIKDTYMDLDGGLIAEVQGLCRRNTEWLHTTEYKCLNGRKKVRYTIYHKDPHHAIRSNVDRIIDKPSVRYGFEQE